MVSSSKKKRGQQRKKDRIPNIVFTLYNDGSADVQPDHKKYVIQHIQGRNHFVTEVLASYDVANFSLEDSGVLSVILDFLKRCEDETFIQVASSISHIGERLKTPSLWIDILDQAVSQEARCMLQIAENIGPLVRCMCNDMERVFFKSNKHWREGIDSFVRLVYNIIYTCWDNSADKKIVQTLLQKNEGLLTSIIQWGFWSKENRPDLTKVLTLEGCADIAELGRDSTVYLIADEDNFLRDDEEDLTEDGKEMVKLIGTTPVVSKDYNPNCELLFVVGLVKYMKTDEWEEIHFDALMILIIDVDCVDKGVITEMIDWGLKYVAELNDAVEVARVSGCLLWRRRDNLQWPMVLKVYANDARTAFAVRAGLIDMCLDFIDKFGKIASIDQEDDGPKLFPFTRRIFRAIHEVSLHQKTTKAIRSKRVEIEKRLLSLEGNTDITGSSECKRVLDMVRSILNISGSYCSRCNKSLSRTEVKQCNRCNIMTYCSRACQREDWLNGHSVTCCTPNTHKLLLKFMSHKLAGRYQGRCLPKILPESGRAAAALKELEVNVSMIQLKLYLDNSEHYRIGGELIYWRQ